MTKYTRFEAIFRNETLVFTEWFKVFRRRGRWYAYHCIGMDI